MAALAPVKSSLPLLKASCNETELIDSLYQNLAQLIQKTGLSASQAENILHAKKVTHLVLPRGKSSVFESPFFGKIPREYQAHLLKILNLFPCSTHFDFFTIFHAKIFQGLNKLCEDLGETAELKRLVAEFAEVITFFYLRSECKHQIDHLVKNHPARTIEHIKILRLPLFSKNPQGIATDLIRIKEKISSLSFPLKEELMLDFDLFIWICSSISEKEITEFGFLQNLFAHRECTTQFRTFSDLLPIVEYYHTLLKHLTSPAKSKLLKERIPLSAKEYFQCFETILGVLKRLEGRAVFTKQDIKTIYLSISRVLIHTGAQFAEVSCFSDQMVTAVNQGKKTYLDSDLRNLEKSLAYFFFDKGWINFAKLMLDVIEFTNTYNFSGHFDRAFFLTIIMGLTKKDPCLKVADPNFEILNTFFSEAARLKLYKADLNTERGLINNLLIGHFEETSLEELEALLQKKISSIEKKESTPEKTTEDVLSEKTTNFLAVKFWTFANILYMLDKKRFCAGVEKLKKKLDKYISSIGPQIDRQALQEVIREGFFRAFEFQLYELLLYRDITFVLEGKKDEELIPQPLLDLLFFAVPGVDDSEDEAEEEKKEEVVAQASVEKEKPPLKGAPVKKELKKTEEEDLADDILTARRSRQILAILNKLHFHAIRQKGSHAIFGLGEDGQVVVPLHEEIKRGTLQSIYRQVKEAQRALYS